MLGDTECKGFLHHCFQIKQGCHYFCCLYLETLNKITSKSFNTNSDKYLKIFSCLPLTKLKQLGIGHHLDVAGLKRCKEHIFEFIYLLESLNPRTNYQTLFCNVKSKNSYEAWKAKRHGLSRVHEEVYKDPIVPKNLSAAQVFSQPLAPDELFSKYCRFAEGSQDLRADSQLAEVEAVVDISNFDMAVLRSTIGMSADFASPAASNSQHAKVLHPAIDSEIRERLRHAVSKGVESTPSRTCIEKSDKHEAVVLQLFKDGVVEIRLQHKNTTFILKLKRSLETQRIWKAPGTVTTFHFVSALDHDVATEQVSRTVEIEDACQRKISLDSAVCDYGWSNSSTVAGSEAGQTQKSMKEVVCNLSGELAFEVGAPQACLSRSHSALSINLFLTAMDKASTALMQALPDIKQLVNTAIVESFFLLATC